ncbi:MAG: zinc-binding dehydrogenase [Woeseiaceae bacterium]|nr:zinc-binding dehydrogenase [Woeseiaceae bacterium]NIP20593.1 zinc-binding dehydrogenase [Woeseiaceae bacterium]NIS89386.1 zinc-binding dehydrogenase [Woeseiaceae bacterium]
MQAAWFGQFGPANQVLELGEMTTPTPGPGEVLVRLRTSAINPSDVKKRAGSFPNLLDDGPVVPNSDGAGIIDAVGDGIDPDRVGERVWIYQAQYARRLGTAAQFVAIDAVRAPVLPGGVGFDVGACLGIPAMTAHRCVFADGDVSGQAVLVTGGAGRVGHYAVQWASLAGASVIATASNDADADACRAAGAKQVVNHRSADCAAAILDATGGKPLDRIVDVEFGANLDMTLEVLRVGGTIATYSSTQVAEPAIPFFKMMYKDVTVRFVIVYAMPEAAKQAAIAAINAALAEDRLQHRIAATMPLEDIAAGNELVERGGVRGAVILAID